MNIQDSGQDRQPTIPARDATLLSLAKSPNATIDLTEEQLEQMREADARMRPPHATKR